jgi:hypothetical protein
MLWRYCRYFLIAIAATLPLLFGPGLSPVAAVDRDEFLREPSSLRPSNPLETASANGKYRNLLRQIACPQDLGSYGYFRDYGQFSGTSWGGHEHLPPGYWVYLYPHWYIWGEVGEK